MNEAKDKCPQENTTCVPMFLEALEGVVILCYFNKFVVFLYFNYCSFHMVNIICSM